MSFEIFRSGHLHGMTFVQGVKSFFTCPCCLPASPAHLLDCWGISLGQLFHEQDLVCGILLRKGLIDGINITSEVGLEVIWFRLNVVVYKEELVHMEICQVIYSQFGSAIHQNDHQARRRFVEWAQNEIAVVPDFQKRIFFSDEAHFWLNGYVNKQNCRIWSEANPQVYVETPLHPEKLTVWCALWAGGILLQKR
ncbi:uncharacterized protein TNCV_3561771 [Trichonephila clavipes]|nr:uncharacterized protein TNCV_3561771 [Trichonephila clavipes]